MSLHVSSRLFRIGCVMALSGGIVVGTGAAVGFVPIAGAAPMVMDLSSSLDDVCNTNGHRDANAYVDVGVGDRTYIAHTNEYGQVVTVTAPKIVLQNAAPPVPTRGKNGGRYCDDEAKVPGVESKELDEGHIIADSLGGASNAYNITPQDSSLNREGEQAQMEEFIRKDGGASNFVMSIEYPDTQTQIPAWYSVIWQDSHGEWHSLSYGNGLSDYVGETTYTGDNANVQVFSTYIKNSIRARIYGPLRDVGVSDAAIDAFMDKVSVSLTADDIYAGNIDGAMSFVVDANKLASTMSIPTMQDAVRAAGIDIPQDILAAASGKVDSLVRDGVREAASRTAMQPHFGGVTFFWINASEHDRIVSEGYTLTRVAKEGFTTRDTRMPGESSLDGSVDQTITPFGEARDNGVASTGVDSSDSSSNSNDSESKNEPTVNESLAVTGTATRVFLGVLCVMVILVGGLLFYQTKFGRRDADSDDGDNNTVINYHAHKGRGLSVSGSAIEL